MVIPLAPPLLHPHLLLSGKHMLPSIAKSVIKASAPSAPW